MVIALALLALVLPILVLAAWHLERQERNDQIRAERAARAQEWQAWQAERRELLNRIKPETAQYAAPADAPAPPQRVGHDVDGDYWNAVGDISKEELADRVDAYERAHAQQAAAVQ